MEREGRALSTGCLPTGGGHAAAAFSFQATPACTPSFQAQCLCSLSLPSPFRDQETDDSPSPAGGGAGATEPPISCLLLSALDAPGKRKA